ncbi:MAG: PIN domain-containing protein [Gaiellaceae bacterium]
MLLAAADNADADPDHQACAEAIQHAGPLVTTALVVAETPYLIGRQLGAAAEARFFRAVADRELQIETMTPADARRIAELIETYADLASAAPTPA